MTPNSVDKREDSNMKTDPRIVSEHKFSDSSDTKFFSGGRKTT